MEKKNGIDKMADASGKILKIVCAFIALFFLMLFSLMMVGCGAIILSM